MLTKSTSQAMKEVPRWLVWKYGEPDAKGKCPKIPHNARTRFRCDPTNPDNWTTHDEAAAMAGFDGLGFVLGDGWQGIDFDAVDANGLSDLVNAATGYVEYSPSGAGAHAIGFGQPFPTLASNASGLEAYSGGRYFTFTGNGFRDDPLTDLAPFVAQAVAPRHGAGKAAGQASPPAREQGAAGPLDAATMAQLADALACIDADSRESWIAVIAALKSVPNNGGFDMAREWSRRSSKHDDAEFAAKWAEDWKHSSYRAVFSMAQANGWQNPGWRQDVAPVQHGLAAFDPRTGQGVSPFQKPRRNLIELRNTYTGASLPGFVVEGWIPEDDVTLWTGDGGIGKTEATLQTGLRVCAQAGHMPFTVKKAVPVGFWSAEDSEQRISVKVEAICASSNVQLGGEWTEEKLRNFTVRDITGLHLWEVDRNNPAGKPTPAMLALPAEIAETGAKLLFIDDVAIVCQFNLSDPIPVTAFVNYLRKIAADTKCAIVLLGHVSADSAVGTTRKSFFGTQAWHNAVRSRIFMEKVAENGDMPEHVRVSHEKSNYGPIMEPFRLRRNSATGILAPFTNHEVAAAIDESFGPLVEKVFGHVQQAQDRNEAIRVAVSGSKTAYHCLAEMFPRDYPEADAQMKRRVKLAIAKLSDEGRIAKRNSFDKNRNPYQVWMALRPDDPFYGKGVAS